MIVYSTSSSTNVSCDSFKARIIMTAGSVMYLLVLPVFLSVLFIGYRKWKKLRSGSATPSLSHSDAFTYHMVALEMKSIVGTLVYCYGTYADRELAKDVGTGMVQMTSAGQVFFHCLTCGERYLAVVHPITYLHLKKRGGVTIRNVCIGVTWLFAFSQILIKYLLQSLVPYLVLGCCLSFCAFVIVIFCSVSVLRVLIRPGPGEKGGDKKRIDQSKRAAFNTMMAILGVLLLRFTMLVFHYAVTLSESPLIDTCVTRTLVRWFELPSSLVLPLLFLHREGEKMLK